MRFLGQTILLMFLTLLVLGGCAPKPPNEVIFLRVMAPQYLKGILEKPAEQFYEENKIRIKLIYEYHDSIFVRAKENPLIDIFISNYPHSFDKLRKDSLILSGKYSRLFQVGLVAIGRLGGPVGSEGPYLKKPSELKGEIFRRIAIVDPARSYEGQLSRQILREYNIWNKIDKKLIEAKSAEHLLTYIISSEADAAILLEASLDGYKNIPILYRFEDKLAEYLVLCGAVTGQSRHPEVAQAFLDLFDSRLCAIYDHRGIYPASNSR